MRAPELTSFDCVRAEGGLLTPDILRRIAALDTDLPGLLPQDYATSVPLRECTSSAWNRLLAEWAAFRGKVDAAPAASLFTTETREKWLLPLCEALGFGRPQPAHGLTRNGRSFAISHQWESVPIHLVGSGVDLDKRSAGVPGAAKSSPHSLVQDYLNEMGEQAWGIVSNGNLLRLLRNSHRVTRQQFVEFDLERMMTGQSYDDFVVLWLVCHRSRFERRAPVACWLEQWSAAVAESGVRALDGLRAGVTAAIEVLGAGFLTSENAALRERLERGTLAKQDYYQQVLRVVYRLIFLCAAEDRDLLFAPGTDATAKERYTRYYSTQRLRRLALRLRGTRHGDLYAQLQQVFAWLGSDEGFAPLGLPPLDSFLFAAAARSATPDLDRAYLTNASLLEAMRKLSLIESDHVLRAVSFRDLGAEELGGVYESLLEQQPEVNLDAMTFSLSNLSDLSDLSDDGGSEEAQAQPTHKRKGKRGSAASARKTTGSYYTPTSLINALITTALDPVIKAVIDQQRTDGHHGETIARQLLTLRICDPACGSGHFLIAAAHRLAREVARQRTGESEPSLQETRAALREVITQCIYGVDLNPMAIELCKVNLWLEALDPGKPLSFLDHHIKCGNAVLGVMADVSDPAFHLSIPPDAFTGRDPAEKAVARSLKEQLKRHLAGQRDLVTPEVAGMNLGAFAAEAQLVDAIPQDTLAGVHQIAAAVEAYEAKYASLHLLADAWCAAFFWPLDTAHADEAPLPDTLRRLRVSPDRVTSAFREEVVRLAQDYHFFHWRLEFPEVMGKHRGGFDVVLGNPPWEQIELEPREFFAATRSDIANAPNTHKRDQLIAEGFRNSDREVLAYKALERRLDCERNFLRASGRFPLGSRGRINLYAVFAENNWNLLSPQGRTGVIVPTGIATDSFTQELFRSFVERQALASLYDFENREGLFPDVDSRTKFSLLTLTGHAGDAASADVVCFAQSVADLDDRSRHVFLAANDFALFNPNTRTLPIFRSRRDEALTRKMYEAAPILVNERTAENPWGIKFQLMFMMNSDSHLFKTRGELAAMGYAPGAGNVYAAAGLPEYAPLYEGKMIHQFDHRFGTFESTKADKTRDTDEAEHRDPAWEPQPRYWVPRDEVERALGSEWSAPWILAFRDIARSTDERTFISSAIPRVGVGNNAPLLLISKTCREWGACLQSNLSSLVLDYVARQKAGGTHLNFFIVKQLPILPPDTYQRPHGETTVGKWVTQRAVELSYTGESLRLLARDLGYDGPPYRWDELRRAQLRAELDAMYARLYGLTRDELAYITTTFPVLQHNEEKAFGEYRTAQLALAAYDAQGSTAST